jgi:hypothetical protein
MQGLQAQDDRLRERTGGNVQQFNALKTLENPAHRRTGGWLVDLIGNGLLAVSQLRADPMFSQTVHQQAQDHYKEAIPMRPSRYFFAAYV